MTTTVRIGPVLLCVLLLCSPSAAVAPPSQDASDPLPPGAILRLGTARLRHPAHIESLSFSPDGRTIAAADYEGRVRLWDTTTGKLDLELPSGTGSAVLFSSLGRTLATADRWGGRDIPVRLWDAGTGKLVRTFSELSGRCLAFAADGATLAGADDQNRVVVCRTDSGEVVRRLEGLTRSPVRLAFSRDGKALAGGDEGGGTAGGYTVIVWDLATGKERCRPIDKPTEWVYDLAFSPDGNELGTATPYKVNLWNAHTGKHLSELGGGACNAVVFDRSAGRIVTGGDDIQIWDRKTRKVLSSIHQGRNFPRLVVLSTDGKWIATNAVYDHRIRLWNVETGKQRLIGPGHLDEVRAVAWSADNEFIATGCGGDGTVRLWDTQMGKMIRKLLLPGDMNHFSQSRDLSALSFSPDSRSLSVAGRRWQVSTGAESAVPVGWGPTAHSPDGKRFAMPDRESETNVVIQDEVGRVLHRFQPTGKEERSSGRGARALVFSPDSRLLAISSVPDRVGREADLVEDSVHLWDATTGKRVRGMRPSQQTPENLAFSPDASLLATSEWRGHPELFDVATGRRLFLLNGHADGDRHWDGVRPLAFSPNGAFLAISGKKGEIVMWETASGQEVRVLRGHEGWVRALAFSPDGMYLLSGGSDTTAIVWLTFPPPVALAHTKPDSLWATLADDAAEAHRALGALRASPDVAVRLLKERLQPEEPVDARTIGKHIADLDAEVFETRQKANAQLRTLGVLARPALQRALAAKPTLEQTRRIERLLARLEAPPDAEELRSLRAIHLLEQLGTPGAVAILKTLARGAEGGTRTRAATAALARLEAARLARLR